MQFYYENQGTNSFLVYQLSEDDKLDSFNYGMIANNKINGIIPANLTQLNAQKYLKYNVSSTVTLKQYFEGIVNKNRIVNVFLSIVNAMIEAEEYMIDGSMFVLNMEYIFVDVSSAKASIISLPIVSYHTDMKPLEFFKSIIFTIQYDRTENADYVAEIITYLNSGDQFSLQGFKQLLTSFVYVSTKAVQSQPQPQPQSVVKSATQPKVQPQPQPQPQPVVKPQPQPVAKPVPQQPVVQTPVPPKANTPKPNTGFEIPGGGSISAPPASKAPQSSGDQNKMSFMHLLTNFSKENLEAYKAQKNAQQPQQAAMPSAPVEAPAKKRNSKKEQNRIQGNPVAGFEIPGSTPAAPVQQPAPVNIPKQPSIVQPTPSAPVTPAVSTPVTPVVSAAPVAPVQQFAEAPANFGATTTLGVGGSVGTTVLGAAPVSAGNAAPQINPRLIRGKTNEKISINKPVFRIGKEHSYVDYFVADNSAISRSHANIVNRDNKFFIVDTNSTNHTYVNGVMLQSNVETEINDKDMIRLANEDFEFRIY